MILAGDIGGTKTLLALYEYQQGRLQEIICTRYPSADFDDFFTLLADFLAEVPLDRLEAAAFGVAGPVFDQQCRATNLPWVISTGHIRQRLGTDRVFLLNDLQATAYGMLHLADEDFITLNEGNTTKGNAAVIAAGTGLGEGILYHDDNGQWHPIATEGGHCEFAPQTARQDRLLGWLRQYYPEHVSIERILSGPGIRQLYQFILEDDNDIAEPTPLGSALITERALGENDAACIETLELFSEIYGAEAGNLALKCLARGGVFIGGGIAPKILPILQRGQFIEAFTHKGRFSSMLSAIPVRVSLNEHTALLGAAWYALHH